MRDMIQDLAGGRNLVVRRRRGHYSGGNVVSKYIETEMCKYA